MARWRSAYPLPPIMRASKIPQQKPRVLSLDRSVTIRPWPDHSSPAPNPTHAPPTSVRCAFWLAVPATTSKYPTEPATIVHFAPIRPTMEGATWLDRMKTTYTIPISHEPSCFPPVLRSLTAKDCVPNHDVKIPMNATPITTTHATPAFSLRCVGAGRSRVWCTGLYRSLVFFHDAMAADHAVAPRRTPPAFS